jgi:hypothetical protein
VSPRVVADAEGRLGADGRDYDLRGKSRTVSALLVFSLAVQFAVCFINQGATRTEVFFGSSSRLEENRLERIRLCRYLADCGHLIDGFRSLF